MTTLLQILALAMSAYGVYGALVGVVYGKSGMAWVKVTRDASPRSFWGLCGIYIVMGQVMFWTMRHYLASQAITPG